MRLHWIIPIAILLLALPVCANEAYNFQTPADFISHFTVISPNIAWEESVNGGNSFVHCNVQGGTCAIRSTNGAPFTYAAATLTRLPGGGDSPSWSVNLLDSTSASLYITANTKITTTGELHRIELRMIGGVAYIYDNGVEVEHSGVLAQNPSYIEFRNYESSAFVSSNLMVDDVVIGSDEALLSTASDKYVYGMPETQSSGEPYYVILKDFINPAAVGFYYGNGTLIDSHHFTSTFSKGNNISDIIHLQGYATGVNVLTNNTGTVYTGPISWDLDSFFAATPDYGLYTMHSESSSKYSEPILYTGNGATIAWDKHTYSQGESGVVLTSVTDGGYWDPATYNYRVDVIDAYGVIDATYPVTTQIQNTTHTWDADQDIGAYYAVIIATPLAGGDDIWMAAALTEVDSYLTMHGFVFNTTESVISGANVNITQDARVVNVITPSDGNYTVSNLSQGSTIFINVSAVGYEDYYHQFVPLRVGALELNFTLMPLSPTYTGVALGGIAREPPYNRTIASARIDIQNTTDGHMYSVTTNSVGYYVQNDMAGPSHWFDVWGSKTGFLNSTVYQKLVVGS